MAVVTFRALGFWVTVAALAVLGVFDLVQHYDTAAPAAMALSVVRVAPLLGYRRMPVEMWVTELVALLVTALVTVPVSPDEPWPWAVTSTASVAVLAGLVASLGRRGLSIVMFAVLTGLGLLLAVWPGRGDWTSPVITVVVVGVAMVVGDHVHGRGAIEVELAEERKISAEERALRSVVEERARIARELHDVVAHHMSMITVQAETARFRHADVPSAVAGEFTEIAKVARTSLSELRGLLSALRDDGADAHRAPQPTLADVRELVDRITSAGTPVSLDLPPDTTGLPQVVELAVYRIVQEALSNVVRHANGADTRVVITRSDTALDIEVTNERPPVSPDSGTDPGTGAGGHGLIGLRERATLLGGTFTTDRPAGGWRVRATLPIQRGRSDQ
jgi:signal transduction histidine kinase